MATAKEIVINGVVTEVTEFDHSAQEIDDATSRALEGGAIDQLLAGKAPAGYGLGETVGNSGYITSAAALDATVKGGIYYYCNSDEQATGYPYSQFGMVVVIATEAVMRQYFFPRQTDTRWWVRQKTNYSDTWGSWEWGKAPMELGVEYRTTERYQGKPVYAKCVNFGSLPNNTTKDITWSTSGIVSDVIHASVITSNGSLIGGVSLSGAEFTATRTNIYIKTTGDYSSMTAEFLLKYTKMTD